MNKIHPDEVHLKTRQGSICRFALNSIEFPVKWDDSSLARQISGNWSGVCSSEVNWNRSQMNHQVDITATLRLFRLLNLLLTILPWISCRIPRFLQTRMWTSLSGQFTCRKLSLEHCIISALTSLFLCSQGVFWNPSSAEIFLTQNWRIVRLNCSPSSFRTLDEKSNSWLIERLVWPESCFQGLRYNLRKDATTLHAEQQKF